MSPTYNTFSPPSPARRHACYPTLSAPSAAAGAFAVQAPPPPQREHILAG
jgi:hypothetical protein